MPTEEFEKGKFYFKGENDKEYKELGTGTVLESNFTEEEKEFNNLCCETEEEIAFDIETKRYKRKRFKKLLMARGIQRNDAELYSRHLCKTQLELDIFFDKEREVE